jgi:hypothetical protein
MILDGSVNVIQGNVSLEVIQQAPGLAIVQNSPTAILSVIPTGSAGAPAGIDIALGGENVVASQILSMELEFARAFPFTAAASRAYTSTPPLSAPVTIQLLDNGTPFGTATWAVGQNTGMLSFNAPTAPFVRGDVPGFQMPNPLDSAFTQFTVTFAGP